ncbi:MAG: TetR/AcrR family transcriptional regulator [Clostridium sp.]|nr:TetR/AcrR family transcriptional regulator [Clostridium sp.]
MPKGSPELTNARKNEIMDACERLYRTMNFRDITLKEVGAVTTFTRTSIYNYFHSKEEIFLGLFQREYELWNESLRDILGCAGLDRETLIDLLAASVEDRQLMLKLLSINLCDIEENSRMDRLVACKKAYGESVELIDQIFKEFCPEWDELKRKETIRSVFVFLYGIYPFAFRTEKQEEAMEQAGIPGEKVSVYDLAVSFFRMLLA